MMFQETMQHSVHDLYPIHLATWDREDLEASIQRRAQVVPVAHDLVLARVLTRQKLFLRPSDLGFGCHVMMDGYWEMWLTRFLARTVQPGMRVVDVGANFGYYTTLLADIVGASGAVLAIEPNPDAVALLQRSVQLNGYAPYTQIRHTALGRHPDGAATLFIPESEPKNAALGTAAGRPGQEIEVPITNLDSVTQAAGPIDFIKIDAEGGEEQIIAGMEWLLSSAPPRLVLEFNALRGQDPAAMLTRLQTVYGTIAEINFDADVEPVTMENLLTIRRGEDRLLYFDRDYD